MTYLPGPNYSLNDHFFHDRLKEYIQEKNVNTVIETGLNDGQSTLAFTKIAPYVIGIDIDPNCINATRQRLDAAGATNYNLIQGDSAEVLQRIRPTLQKQLLIFLDAHWECVSPLPRELTVVADHYKDICAIILHDFKVPGYEHLIGIPGEEWGFDGVLLADGRIVDCDYDLVKPFLDRWSPVHRIEYARALAPSPGCRRGWAIVHSN